MSADKATIEKLKKILQVSDRVKFDTMRDALNMDKKSFNSRIFDWAVEFNFRINEDVVVINKDSVDDFIDMLDSQFETWGKKELSGTGKIEHIKIEKVVVEKRKKQEEKTRKDAEEKARKEAEKRKNQEVEEKAKRKAQLRKKFQFEANVLQQIIFQQLISNNN